MERFDCGCSNDEVVHLRAGLVARSGELMSSATSGNGVGIKVVMETQKVSIDVDTAKHIGISWVWYSKFVLANVSEKYGSYCW